MVSYTPTVPGLIILELYPAKWLQQEVSVSTDNNIALPTRTCTLVLKLILTG